MRMMVLHLYKRQAFFLGYRRSIFRGHIVRVQIADHGLRSYIKQAPEMFYLSGIIFQRLKILQVTDMLARENVAPL